MWILCRTIPKPGNRIRALQQNLGLVIVDHSDCETIFRSDRAELSEHLPVRLLATSAWREHSKCRMEYLDPSETT